MKIRFVSIGMAFATALTFPVFAADQPKAKSIPKPAATAAPTVAAPADNAAEVIARINGTEIKRDELDAAVQALTMQMAQRGRQMPLGGIAQLQNEVLDQMIGRELLLQEGGKHVPADIDQKVKSQIEMAKKQLGGEDQFRVTLSSAGIAPSEYTQRVRENIIIQQAIQLLADKQPEVTPEEIKSFYDKNPDQFHRPETVRASHILIRMAPDASDDVKKEKRAQIEAARSLVKNGEKFADIAKKVSEDPGSAQNGGDLGFFPRGAMVPEFDAAAFSLKTNELSEVITTQFGYHVLLVTDHKPAQTIPFDEVKDTLGQFLKQRKGSDLVRNHIAELRKSAKVEILLPALPSAPAVGTPPVPAPTK